MTKSNKELEIRELEKRVAALEKQLNDHMFPNNDVPLASSGDRTFGYIAGTYDPKTGISTEGGNYRIGYFDPNEPVKGAAVNRGMGNDALLDPRRDAH